MILSLQAKVENRMEKKEGKKRNVNTQPHGNEHWSVDLNRYSTILDHIKQSLTFGVLIFKCDVRRIGRFLNLGTITLFGNYWSTYQSKEGTIKFKYSCFNEPFKALERDTLLLEKLRVANMVVSIAPLSLRRALNFLRQSTVSWRCNVDATRSRWQIQGCFNASAAVIRFAGLTVSIELIKFFASGVTVSHSGEGYYISDCRVL